MVKHLSHLRRNEALAVTVCTILLVLMYMMGVDITAAVTGTKSVCGNGACEVGEHIMNCEGDCNAVCGNSVCENAEKLTCPIDCNNTTEATESVQFQLALAFTMLVGISLVMILLPISKFGTRRKVRKGSRRRRKR